MDLRTTERSGLNRPLFLQKGMDEKSKNHVLFYAVRDQPAIIEKQSGHASRSDNLDPFAQIVKLLLENGAQVNTRDEEGRTPLMEAAGYGRLTTVRVLLDKDADLEAIDDYGNTALLLAACDCALATMPDTYETAKLLLESGANVNVRNKDGDTPLMIASGGGVVKTQIVELLIEKGADLRSKNAKGETALTIARKDKLGDVIRLLRNASTKRH